MEVMRRTGRAMIAVGGIMLALLQFGPAAAQQAATDDQVAALKQSLASSREALGHYTWTETKVVNYKGEQKSSAQSKCHYGADGKVVKEPTGTQPVAEEKKGLRGHRAEKVAGDIEEYMTMVAALIDTYVPPSPDRIQKCKDAGKLSIEIPEPDKRIVVRLRDYNIPGDSVALEIDITTNTLLGYDVATYIDEPADAVLLDVTFGKLGDGSVHPAAIAMTAEAKSVKVDITNSDYAVAGN